MNNGTEFENGGLATEHMSHSEAATQAAAAATSSKATAPQQHAVDFADTTAPIPATAVKIAHSPAPLGGGYYIDGVIRTVRKTLLLGGGTVNSRLVLDGIGMAVPVLLFNTEPTIVSAGPGSIEGILQATARFQIGNSRFVRVTGYGPDADTLLAAVKDCHNSNLRYLRKAQELHQQNMSAEEIKKQLDAMPKRIMYFDMAGEWRPDIRRGAGFSNNQPQTHVLRSEMSIKLAELAIMWSDGTSEKLIGETNQPAGASAALELGSEL